MSDICIKSTFLIPNSLQPWQKNSSEGDAEFEWECVGEDSQKAKDAINAPREEKSKRREIPSEMVDGIKYPRYLDGTRKICAFSWEIATAMY